MSTASPKILDDKYRLIRPLDEGGMGSVWLAEHLALASPVAIKLIPAEVAKTADRLQRFLREARAAAASRGPHVVQVLDYGVHEGTPYIVMERLEGESLAERLRRRVRISPAETETIIRHVSRAVTRAHEAGIVHRDLKPANIFITRNEDEEVIKIFDFGIAKAAEAAGGGAPKATRAGALLGTPYYMSPEQLEGGRRCDYRADIWAMGVIAFECLLGRLPFHARGLGGLVLSVCSNPLPVPSALGEVPPGFDAWFARACCRDLERRFASARDAARALRRVVGASLASTGGPSTGEPDAGEPSAGLEGATLPVLPRRERAPLESAERAPFESAGLGPPAEIGGARAGRGTISLRAHLAAGAETAPPSARAPLPSARAPLPSAALESTTSDAASATLDREAARRRPHPSVLVAPVVVCVGIALALRGGGGDGGAGSGAPNEAGEVGSRASAAAAPALQPPRPRTRLRVLGDGPELRASVDGQDVGPVPCEVEGIGPGEHTVVIRGSERYRPSHARVHLEPGAVTTVGPVQLEVASGLATIVAGEGAEGAALSVTAGDTTLRLPPLPVQLELETAQQPVLHAEKPGFVPYRQPLVFEDGQAEKTFTVELSLAPKSRRSGKKARTQGRRSSSRPGRARPAPRR